MDAQEVERAKKYEFINSSLQVVGAKRAGKQKVFKLRNNVDLLLLFICVLFEMEITVSL